jgi:hypothetical protein
MCKLSKTEFTTHTGLGICVATVFNKGTKLRLTAM